ncbi:hypothetical protein [Streptomyces sp. NPDC057412]|uniref:hypothetical protein n=1 Tax=Streptomyces sp. NPDC057412 TaxID=3346123 RepID=UPI0036B78153
MKLEDDNWVTIEGAVLYSRTSDLILDSPNRRRAGIGGKLRRALVHNQDDGLTINFNGDYPGGVTVTAARLIDARLALHVERQVGAPKLPKRADVGSLVMLHNTTYKEVGGRKVAVGESSSLWLCVSLGLIPGTSPVEWREIPLGQSVQGSE